MGDAPPGIEVVRYEADDDGYRASGRPKTRVEIRWRWWRPTMWRLYATIALLIALDLLLALLLRYFVVEMETWTPVVLVAFFIGLPLAFGHVSTLQYLTSRTTLEAGAEGVRVAWGPIWGGERSVSLDEIGQLFVQESRGRAVVVNLTPAGKARVVAQHLDPVAARFVEREVERALALEDRPVRGELPRGDALGAAVKRPLLRPLLMGGSAVVGIAIASYFLAQPAGRTAGVSLLEGPVELAREVEADEVASFWTATRATSAIGTGGEPRVYYLAGRVEVTLEIRRERGAPPVATLRCDPFGSSFFDWQSIESGFSETDYSFVARMDDCAVRFPDAGPVFVRAELTRPDAEIRLERLELLVR